MISSSSQENEKKSDEIWIKKIYRDLFISVHRPGPLTVFSMLAFAACVFFIAYALGNWVFAVTLPL